MTNSEARVPARPAQTDCARAFWAWRQRHRRQSDDPQAVWVAAWNAGGAAAIYNSSELAGLVPAVDRLTAYLENAYADAHDGDMSGAPGSEWTT